MNLINIKWRDKWKLKIKKQEIYLIVEVVVVNRKKNYKFNYYLSFFLNAVYIIIIIKTKYDSWNINFICLTMFCFY